MVLDAIFQGTFSVESFSRPKDPEYKELRKSIDELSFRVKDLLGTENSRLLDELLSQVYAAQYMEAEACFKGGFSAGLQLQRESTELLQSLNLEA